MIENKINEVEDLKKELELMKSKLKRTKEENKIEDEKTNKGLLKEYEELLQELSLKEIITEDELKELVQKRSSFIISDLMDNEKYKENLSNSTDKEKQTNAVMGIVKEATSLALEEKDIAELFKKVISDENLESYVNIGKTKYPKEFISPKDRITGKLFEGELTKELRKYKTEAPGRKELTVMASMFFDDLKGITLSNNDLSIYDRAVHDAIVTLYVDGGNNYVTTLMIHRVITGNPEAKLSSGSNRNIVNSIEKLSMIRVYIDATGELSGKGYNFNKEDPTFSENLIYTRTAPVIHNGEVKKVIQIIDTPILYKYAGAKNQISRINMNILNTPINKNKEIIELQSYLTQRIEAMKGSTKQRRVIVLKTVYRNLDLKQTTPGAIRKKHSRLRNHINTILTDWKEKEYITDYSIKGGKINISLQTKLNSKGE